MVSSGKIFKLAKGKYFKPEKTPFGTLQPSQGKIIGYLTGYSIYNMLERATQV